jgi:1-deoxy-D-xylulose-5-phosphate synthase
MDTLTSHQAEIALYDARFAMPVDIALIRALVEAGSTIVTIEDHARSGGFGSSVLEACNDHGLSTDRIHRLAMPRKWMPQDSRENQLSEAGLDAAGIARTLRQLLSSTEPAGSNTTQPTEVR